MGNASLSGARRPYKRDESEGPLSVQLSEKDVSAALRLLKAIVGDEGDLVRAMSDDRDEKVGVLVGQPTKPQNWVPLARSVFLGRRRRGKYFPPSMIGEPAWDMMLALYITERSESRMTTTRLAEYAGAAMTTALRWIDALAQHGFVVRKASPTDKRVVFIELSDQGRAKLDEYFGSLSSLGFDPDSHG